LCHDLASKVAGKFESRKEEFPLPDPSEHLNLIHRLKEEIDRLTEEQTDAMKSATFIGLTTDEAKEYEGRRTRILELVEQLRLLEEAA
jgi:hypothetical protein